jgi:hypothetical protein
VTARHEDLNLTCDEDRAEYVARVGAETVDLTFEALKALASKAKKGAEFPNRSAAVRAIADLRIKGILQTHYTRVGTRRIRYKSKRKTPETFTPASDMECAQDRAQRILEAQPEIDHVEIVVRRLADDNRSFEEVVVEKVKRADAPVRGRRAVTA